MPGILTFDRAAVLAEIEKVKAAPGHREDFSGDNSPALWLVGDQGVYLMGNHANRDHEAEKPVYAKESDPTAEGADFDDWYDAKREIFGGDDGVETFPIDTLEPIVRNSPHETIKFKLTADAISILA